MVYLLLLLVCVEAEIAELSFNSPFLPEHSSKYEIIGSSAPLKRYIRLVPPLSNKQGAVISNSILPASDLDIYLRTRISGSNKGDFSGFTVWTSNTQVRDSLGPVYGVKPTFKGNGIVVDTLQQSIWGYSYFEKAKLSLESVQTNYTCTVPMRGFEFSLKLEFRKQALKVYTWLKDNEAQLCFEVTHK